jgi:hypothetical protein
VEELKTPTLHGPPLVEVKALGVLVKLTPMVVVVVELQTGIPLQATLSGETQQTEVEVLDRKSVV